MEPTDPTVSREERLMEMMQRDRAGFAWGRSQDWVRLGCDSKDWSQASEEELRAGARAWMQMDLPASPKGEDLARRALDLGLRLGTLVCEDDPARGLPPRSAMCMAASWPQLEDNFASALGTRLSSRVVSDHPNFQWSDAVFSQKARRLSGWDWDGAPMDDAARVCALVAGASEDRFFIGSDAFNRTFEARPESREPALMGMALGLDILARRLEEQGGDAKSRIQSLAMWGGAAQGEDPALRRAFDVFLASWRACDATNARVVETARRDQEVRQGWSDALTAALRADEPGLALLLGRGMRERGEGVGHLASLALMGKAPRCAAAFLREGFGVDDFKEGALPWALRQGAVAGQNAPLWREAIDASADALMARERQGKDPWEAADVLERLAQQALDVEDDPERRAWIERACLELSQRWRAPSPAASTSAQGKGPRL